MTRPRSKDDDLFNRGPGVHAMMSLYADNSDELPLGSDDSDLEADGPVLRRGRPISKRKANRAATGNDTCQNSDNAKRKRSSRENAHSVFAERTHRKGFEIDDNDEDDEIIIIDEIPAVKHVQKELKKASREGAVQALDEIEDETLRRVHETVRAALGAAVAIDEEDIALEVQLESDQNPGPAVSAHIYSVPSKSGPSNLISASVASASDKGSGSGVILLRFRFQSDGRIEKVRIRRSDGIVAKVAGPLCAKSRLNAERVSFILDGKVLSLEETPNQLGLIDESLIEVHDIHAKPKAAAPSVNNLGADIMATTVVLKVRFATDNTSKPIAVRIRRSDPILKIRESVCKRANQDPRRIVFFLDGEAINDTDTPDSLDVDDGTLIDATLPLGGT